MDKDFLLNSLTAKKLYGEVAELAIIDYHNHLSLSDIMENKRFYDIYELWLKPDPYKHRAMRMCGIDENSITGSAPDFEKFKAWCSCFPKLIGNPLYIWSLMELEKVFGISDIPCEANAHVLYEKANSYLTDNEITVASLLTKFKVELACPCTSLIDDFGVFGNSVGIAPSLRGDDTVSPDASFIHELELKSGCSVSCLADFEVAVKKRLDEIVRLGCTYADHALDNGFLFFADDGKNSLRFAKILGGEALDEDDKKRFYSYMLMFVCKQYAKLGLTVQLHIGAQRSTSTRLRNLAGAAGGFASIGNSVDIAALTSFLDALEQSEYGLARLILFTLNPSDNAMISVLSGSYSKDGIAGLITQGPAWWWCDHKQGICDVLENTASFGLLSNFAGMTTDSRSFMSFVRHDYFRRILCDWLGAKAESGDFCAPYDDLKKLAYAMCYGNAESNRRDLRK